MVNELKHLMRDNVATPPPDHLDLAAVMHEGRRRTRSRRVAVVGASVLAAGVVIGSALVLPGGSKPGGAEAADHPPAPDGPALSLADATPAVEGRDFRVLTSYTNEDLDADNGQYLDGVTDDGKILFRDGPRSDQRFPRLALMDPSTGHKDWLPDLEVAQANLLPVELGADRLVLVGPDGFDLEADLVAHVFDRSAQQWSTVRWPGLPAVDLFSAVMGPDDRLYVSVPATSGKPPKGGWPMGSDGEADDADAEGDTYHLWSASLDDPADVRDEDLTVGSVAFTETEMVWTDRTNGEAGLVHVRDLTTGAERSFDPHAGERCNLLSFGAVGDRVVMGQYCGTYDDEVRDDRVQILTTSGDQVVTIQDDSFDGGLHTGGGDVVTLTSYARGQAGAYVYDLATNRFLRVSDAVSSFDLGGPVPGSGFMWDTPENNRSGATQWIGELLP